MPVGISGGSILENLSKTKIVDSNGENAGFVCPQGGLKIVDMISLIGGNFFGSSLLNSFWTQTVANNGTITLAEGAVTLSTATTANGSAKLTTVHKARFLAGFNNALLSGVKLGDTGGANNVRRWGAYNDDNGYFFQLNGTTIGVGSRNSTVDTVITSLNGSPFVLDTNYHTYEIVYRFGGAFFYQDRKLVHSIAFNSAAAAVGDANLPIRHETINSGGSTTARTISCRGTSISRLGSAECAPSYINITAAATTVLHNNCGTLHRVVINSKGSAATAAIYDNTEGSGTKIATVDLTQNIATLDFRLDFDNGLTVVTEGSNIDVTIIYS